MESDECRVLMINVLKKMVDKALGLGYTNFGK